MSLDRRHGIVTTAVELTAVFRFPHAAPLLEEERDLRGPTLVAQLDHPLPLHRARAGAAFAADNDPVDSRQINVTQVFQKWLDGQELDRGA